MLFEALKKYFLNIETFHRFSYFLGTDSGELLKRFIELIFERDVKNGKKIK